MPYSPKQLDRPPIEHFDYDELGKTGEECQCPLCEAYRSTYEVYDNFNRINKYHKPGCACYVCSQKTEAQLSYLAALCKRDTFSELSYLTHQHRLGPTFLGWIYDRMQDRDFHSEAWWAIKAPAITLQTWMNLWQRRFMPKHLWGVSGLY